MKFIDDTFNKNFRVVPDEHSHNTSVISVLRFNHLCTFVSRYRSTDSEYLQEACKWENTTPPPFSPKTTWIGNYHLLTKHSDMPKHPFFAVAVTDAESDRNFIFLPKFVSKFNPTPSPLPSPLQRWSWMNRNSDTGCRSEMRDKRYLFCSVQINQQCQMKNAQSEISSGSRTKWTPIFGCRQSSGLFLCLPPRFLLPSCLMLLAFNSTETIKQD